jgi:predicted membrane protein
MKFYNNIYASSYRFYAKFKGETPWSTSIVLVTVCQIELFFLLLVIIKKVTGYNPFLILPNKFYFLPIFIVWLVLLFKYYTKERAGIIVSEFEKKELWQKRIWGALTLISFLLPIILIFILLKKKVISGG